MYKVIRTRLQQGYRTMKYPDGPAPPMPERFRGRPAIDASRCPDGCRACADACPTDAIGLQGGISIDLGRCLFCTDCTSACPEGAITYTGDHRLAVHQRESLIVTESQRTLNLEVALHAELQKLFGRSLQLRHVSAGGCNGCEADVNVLGTVGWDLGRFGIRMVASPRHADGLLITGPVTKNMDLALKATYDAVPEPKIMIAVGACAISGGPYIGHEQTAGGADALLPVDLYIPGCPPHPLTILDGLLRLLGRIKAGSRAMPAP
jgi:Ni,Fe-hydrogenase III small subunit/Pyruvate/2-oxoacid:ferredoxin oxidoreductase delta subunit